MSRVVHFEIHAGDPLRAEKFYGSVFGWTFNKVEMEQPYWLITTGPDDKPGINGGMMKRQGVIDGTAVIAFVCVISVENIDDIVADVQKHDGEIVVQPAYIPGIGKYAYCKDTEGNIFGVIQED